MVKTPVMNRRRIVPSSLLLLLLTSAALTATPPVTSQPTTTPASRPTSAPAATASSYSLAEIADRVQSTAATLNRIHGELSDDQTVANIESKLAALTGEITAHLREEERQLSPATSLDTLRILERDWSVMREQLSGWSAQLSSRAGSLTRDDARLASLQAAWQQTLDNIRAAGSSDAEVAPLVAPRVREIGETLARIGDELLRVRTLQARVTAQDVRVAEAIVAVREAESNAVTQLLRQDSDPIWKGRFGLTDKRDIAADSRTTLYRQWAATWLYIRQSPEGFSLHAFLVVVLAVAASRVRRRWGERLETDPATRRSGVIFRMPLAAAMVATLPLVPWLYPQAPRLLLALLGAAMLVPAIFVMRRMILRPLVPLLYALAAFYLLGLIVSVSTALPAISRILFLLTMISAVALLGWFVWHTPRSRHFSDFAKWRHWKWIQFALRLALCLMAASVVANVLGFVSLSRLLGNGVLASAYVAIMLDACVRVVHALLAVMLQLPPVQALRAVNRHGPMLLRRITWIIAMAAGLWWVMITLELFSIRWIVLNYLQRIFTARLVMGGVSLSLGNVVAFIAAVAVSFLISRFIRFLLAEDVYPRIHLKRGIPYALSTVLHYLILFFGFLMAVAALGYDLTQFTLLAGAFGVGLGFGMQSIVNNFMSGLILLFERPIQVGDIIELDADTIGVVQRIGIRASILRTTASAEVIVPNAILASNRVTNWTMGNRQRGFAVPVSVTGGADPNTVIELLQTTAKQTPGVANTPEPQAFVTQFLPGGGLAFELRVWTERFDDWIQARSQLIAAIHTALADRGIGRI